MKLRDLVKSMDETLEGWGEKIGLRLMNSQFYHKVGNEGVLKALATSKVVVISVSTIVGIFVAANVVSNSAEEDEVVYTETPISITFEEKNGDEDTKRDIYIITPSDTSSENETAVETTETSFEGDDFSSILESKSDISDITPTEEIETEIDNEEYIGDAAEPSIWLSEEEISLLVQAVQHETGTNPGFYPNGDFDIVQQYMAASIINRLGQPGFGPNYTTACSVYTLLSNTVQYGNMLGEVWQFDAYDERTRQNVYAVLNGTAYTPDYLYFERCSQVGESYWSAQQSFYGNYANCPSVEIAYMSLTNEGRYIIFATNPYGAYASAY